MQAKYCIDQVGQDGALRRGRHGLELALGEEAGQVQSVGRGPSADICYARGLGEGAVQL